MFIIKTKYTVACNNSMIKKGKKCFGPNVLIKFTQKIKTHDLCGVWSFHVHSLPATLTYFKSLSEPRSLPLITTFIGALTEAFVGVN